MGAYGPLLLAPVGGLGGPLDPLTSGGDLFLIINEKNPWKSINIWLIYGFVKIWTLGTP